MQKSILFFGLVLMFTFGTTSASSASVELMEGLHKYCVQPGDTLSKMYGDGLTDELLKFIMDINRIDPEHLPLGKTILLPDNPNGLPYFCPVPQEIEAARKYKRKVYIFLKKQYFAVYENGHLQFWGPISSANDLHETPIGTFRVLGKYEKYFSHKKECYGAPMPYAIRITNDGYFLHQQAMPGRPASHGCVRLLMSDARKIFSWIHEKDSVQIMDSMEPVMEGYVTN